MTYTAISITYSMLDEDNRKVPSIFARARVPERLGGGGNTASSKLLYFIHLIYKAYFEVRVFKFSAIKDNLSDIVFVGFYALLFHHFFNERYSVLLITYDRIRNARKTLTIKSIYFT